MSVATAQPTNISETHVWPEEGATRIPDWVYTSQEIYELEVERIFRGKTWNYVALEVEIPNPGDFKRSHVGPISVLVTRCKDGSIAVVENRCAHRGAEFCRVHRGNTPHLVCPYHQWTYDLNGTLIGVPFRRGSDKQGGMPSTFRTEDHGLRKLKVATRGRDHLCVIRAGYRVARGLYRARGARGFRRHVRRPQVAGDRLLHPFGAGELENVRRESRGSLTTPPCCTRIW